MENLTSGLNVSSKPKTDKGAEHKKIFAQDHFKASF